MGDGRAQVPPSAVQRVPAGLCGIPPGISVRFHPAASGPTCATGQGGALPFAGVSMCTLKTSEVFLANVFQSHEEDDRKVRRREKNRVAAQRSRKKQTQKADKLHEEYESLEQENTSLKREIGKLTDEMKHLSEVLKDHEKICPLLHCTMNFVTLPRPDALTSCLPR
ncbi:PREDICTED: basic leucine zipper transcriptional factor ATF-like 3 [Tauraco erythrolophus]|nr:PREDICTED: basic leucine zipper transcriptional factor ATF-like 3 [Tauraco erythrolophus]